MLKIFNYFAKEGKTEIIKKNTFKKPDGYKNTNATTYNK